mmetsp:Transcript_46828/g.117326  ORF Transcript_46828/g.117326 Transcript_46828/m.117326 type:complete len:124 (-) Transcript_46828:491-862(-)
MFPLFDRNVGKELVPQAIRVVKFVPAVDVLGLLGEHNITSESVHSKRSSRINGRGVGVRSVPSILMMYHCTPCGYLEMNNFNLVEIDSSTFSSSPHTRIRRISLVKLSNPRTTPCQAWQVPFV